MKKTITVILVLFMVAAGFSILVEQYADVINIIENPEVEKSPDSNNMGSRAALSPDYLYARNYNSGWLKRLNKDGSNIQNIVNMNIPGSQTMPCMTPDGQWVYARTGSTLYRYSTTNGQQTTYNLAHGGSGYAVGTDGIYLYYGSGSTIHKVTMTGNHVSSSSITRSVSSYYFSVTDGAVWIASGNTWYGWSTNRFTGGNIGANDITWNYGGISSTCMNFAFDGDRYYVVAGGSSSMPMKVYDRNRNFIRQYTVRIDFRSIMCPYGGLSFAENTRVKGRGGGNDVVCYAKYETYGLTVNVTSPKDLNEVSEVKVHLDYNETNATLGYNFTRQEFFKLKDVKGHVQLFLDDCTVTNDGVKRWWLNFTVGFNFTFPHREPVDCFVNTSSVTGEFHRDRFPYLFRVVKDLDFVGTPDFTGQYQGKLDRGGWVRGSENLRISNLTVVYYDSMNIYPDNDYFDVKVADSQRNAWWSNQSSGNKIQLNITTRNVTDSQEWYSITIENIPGSGACKTNLTYPLKVDNDPPHPPLNLVCHADGFKDKETENTDQPLMFATWLDVEDPDSGLLGYYYSHVDNSGTDNGTFINVTEVEVNELPEGYATIHVWCVDNVGNIGEAASSGILVDLTPPTFSNIAPPDGSWHNHSDIDCSVEIDDGEGSGVDGSTIEYSISANGVNGFNMWIPAWVPVDGDKLTPNIKYVFPEGEENYIKWRAKDISENGFSESAPVNIKVDITPISFAGEIRPQLEWYTQKVIETKIMVSDFGSGVDTASIQARISTSGPNDFGQWIPIKAENINKSDENEYEITVTFPYAEGKDNYIMFRGTDMVGNPMTLSDKFNLKIDTTQVYYGSFTPTEDMYADSRDVECFIQIFDDGSGVDVSTIEYSVSTGGGDNKNFKPWKKAVNVVAGNPTQIFMEVEFEWGGDNNIRWRADDMLGTGYNESSQYRIWVNSKPEIIISSPEQGSYFRYDSLIDFDASDSSDEDGDNLSFFWSSNNSYTQFIGSGAYFSTDLLAGKHTITVFVSDGHGYNETDKVKITVVEKADYERDSDGDGFSDGLEREKGTDPNNGADSPDGEPDIIIQDSSGIMGGDSYLLFIILGAILLLIMLVLIILFVVRKKRKKAELDSTPLIQAPMTQQQYLESPYPPGQGIPAGHQGFGEPTQLQAPFRGMQGPEGQYLMLPPGPGMMQFGTIPPGQTPPLVPHGQADPAYAAYSLPSFPTDQGMQNLERMALPPGPPPSVSQVSVDPSTSFPVASQGLPAQTALMPNLEAMETPFSAPPDPITPSGEILPVEPGTAPITPQSPSPPGPTVPPASPSEATDLSQLDSYLSNLDKITQSPESAPPVVPPVPVESPAPATNQITMNHQQMNLLVSSSETQETASPSLPPPNGGDNRRGFLRMQCHSCGNNYTAEIIEYPALVTCPVCQTQGVIQG